MLNIIAIRLLIAFTCRDTQVKNPNVCVKRVIPAQSQVQTKVLGGGNKQGLPG